MVQPGDQLSKLNFGKNASGAVWPNFEPMQIAPLGRPICNWCWWRFLAFKFAASASSFTRWQKIANNAMDKTSYHGKIVILDLASGTN